MMRFPRRLRRVTLRAAAEGMRARHFARLSGNGLEIGPLHNPAPLPESANVRYVDQFDVTELRRRNPDVPADHIVAPDIICDSHRFDGVADSSADFIVASHVLEHLHNPIGALLEWRRVVRDHGLVVCIVPDGRFTFDRGRPFTSLDHLLWDYQNDGTMLKALSDLFHIAECNLNMHESLDRDGSIDLAKRIFDETYDTHFHVWSHRTFRQHIAALIGDCGLPYRVAAAESDEQSEMVMVLEADKGGFAIPDSDVNRSAR